MKNILTAAAVAVISLILQATCPAFAQNGRNISDNQLVDAVSLYNEGHLQEAETLLSSICAASPENDAAWYYRGLTRIKLQNAAGAESDLKKAVSLDKGNFWYRYMLAGLYGMTGRTELTIDMYKELMKDFPKKTDLYYSLAQIYIGQNDLTEALKTIENIETQFGSNDGTVMTRFNILRRQDKGEEAFRVLDEYSKEYSSPQVLTVLGDYAMGMYDDSTALARYDAALDIDRDYAPAILGKAETYRMTRKYNDYFATLDVLTANPQVPAAAKADYLQAVFRQADRQFINTFKPQFDTTVSIAERVHPNDTSILETAGLYYFSTGRREKAASNDSRHVAYQKPRPRMSRYTPTTAQGSNTPTGPFVRAAPLRQSHASRGMPRSWRSVQRYIASSAPTIRAAKSMSTRQAMPARCTSKLASVMPAVSSASVTPRRRA